MQRPFFTDRHSSNIVFITRCGESIESSVQSTSKIQSVRKRKSKK
jgi:hypothetical protein